MVVQLVRIPACHAGGRGFESRPLRQTLEGERKFAFFILKPGYLCIRMGPGSGILSPFA